MNCSNRTQLQLGKNVLLCGAVFLAMVAISVGEVEPAIEFEAAEPVQVIEEPSTEPIIIEVARATTVDPVAPAAAAGADTRYEVVDTGGDGVVRKSFRFEKDFSVRDALTLVASMYGRNIIPSSGVDGQLGFRTLSDVTFEEALRAIVGGTFKCSEQDGLIRVYTRDEYKKVLEDTERLTYRIFTLYYLTAAEAQTLITPVLSSNSKVQACSAGSTLFPTGESISSVTGGGASNAINDTIIVYDYPENLALVAEIIANLDIRPLQILIEATILAVNLTEDTQFGIDWTTLGNVVTGLAAPTATAGSLARGMGDFIRNQGTGQVTKPGGLSFAVTHGDMGMFLRAIETVTDTTIMANPKILAVNKQLGQVYIGTKLGYRSQTTQTNESTTEKVEFLETGTKLSFRPFVGNDGYIRMDIHPKDSSGTLNEQGVPDETSAELVTNIIVKDGETIVIGGMFRDTVTAKKSQIPVLGNLPLLGAAFRGNADQVIRQEVVVLLTPHIIEVPSQTDAAPRIDDIERKRYAAKNGLQSISRPRLAEDYYEQAARHYIEGDNEAAMKQLKKALVIRPTYLEALRLKERIMAETNPDDLQKMERILLEDIDSKEAPKFRRW